MHGEDVQKGVYDYLRVEMELPNVAYGHNVPEELVVNTNSLFQTKSLDFTLFKWLITTVTRSALSGCPWPVSWLR